MGVDHSGAWDLLAGLVLDGLPTGERRAELDAHVSSCLVCRRETRRLEETAEDALTRTWDAVQRHLREQAD
jgi:hypothetical protein